MPKRRDDVKTSEQVGIRITTDLRKRCETAKLSGALKNFTESNFLNYLIEIGLSKYEKNILPHEIEADKLDVKKEVTPSEMIDILKTDKSKTA